VEGRVGGVDCICEITLDPLSPGRTRVSVTLGLEARGVSARLLLQSLKLAHQRAVHRVEGIVDMRARDVERAWARSRADAGPEG
jgi:hypothetical protein